MTLLSFPDVNVWLALTAAEHVHHSLAVQWWRETTGPIAFSRATQMGFLRLITTAAAMDGKPLTMNQAWQVHDRLFEDERVVFMAEPPDVESFFREFSSGLLASPKRWADAWILAFAKAAAGSVVTLDRALTVCGAQCLLD